MSSWWPIHCSSPSRPRRYQRACNDQIRLSDHYLNFLINDQSYYYLIISSISESLSFSPRLVMMCLSSIVEIILKFESISNPLNGQQQNTFKHSASSWKNFQFDGYSFRFYIHFCYKKSQECVDWTTAIFISLLDYDKDDNANDANSFDHEEEKVPAAVLIEDPEGLSDVLLQVGLFELLGHHREELLKVNLTVAITIHLFEDHHLDCEAGKKETICHLIDHIIEFRHSWFLSKTLHNSSELFCADRSWFYNRL